jgi:hypothetical protein
MPRKPKRTRAILAEGEVAGHFHQAEGPGLTFADDVLSVPYGAELTHQEHGPLTLPPGEYVRSIVQEYDHFAEETRKVVD